jgi:hypothetical protein
MSQRIPTHPNASAHDYRQADSQYPDPNKAPPLQPDEIYNLPRKVTLP